VEEKIINGADEIKGTKHEKDEENLDKICQVNWEEENLLLDGSLITH